MNVIEDFYIARKLQCVIWDSKHGNQINLTQLDWGKPEFLDKNLSKQREQTRHTMTPGREIETGPHWWTVRLVFSPLRQRLLLQSLAKKNFA